MNKREAIKKVKEMLAKENKNYTNSQITEILDKFIEVWYNALAKGESVKLSKFGTLKPFKVKERNVRHPKTKEIIKIPSKTKIKFIPSQSLKKELDK